MPRFINILSEILSEAKRYKFAPETLQKINSVVDNLWNDRNKNYGNRKEVVDIIHFKTANGVDGLVKVVVNPRLKYLGFMGTKPKTSYDPADIYIEVNPKYYESKKNLYLTIYHEMIHASDPTQSSDWSPRYMLTYDEKTDEKYWGHPIEFFAISNEFLEGLVREFERRAKRVRKVENREILNKTLKNILNYFAKGEKLNRLSQDILFRINDEHVGDDSFKVLKNLTADMPHLAEILPERAEEPYYLHYVQLIKKYNPEIWKKFLSMLYDTTFEIKDIINKEYK
jgi:hypothetical protein